jgi:hypothetical protein
MNQVSLPKIQSFKDYLMPWCLLLCLMGSCSNPTKDDGMDGKRIVQELSIADKAYRTNNAYHAKAALLHHRDDLLRWRAARVTGIHYDTCLAITCGRLFVLSDYLGDTNLAEASYQESVLHLKGVRKSVRQDPAEYSHESIREMIAKWDATEDVAWRKDAAKEKK